MHRTYSVNFDGSGISFRKSLHGKLFLRSLFSKDFTSADSALLQLAHSAGKTSGLKILRVCLE